MFANPSNSNLLERTRSPNRRNSVYIMTDISHADVMRQLPYPALRVVEAVVPAEVMLELLEVQAGHGAVVLLGELPEGRRTDRAVEVAVDVGQGQAPDEPAPLLGGRVVGLVGHI